jgi:hypothetical protein
MPKHIPLLSIPVVLVLTGAAQAATIPVDDVTDQDPPATNNKCSLREAVTAALGRSAVDSCPKGDGQDTITLPADTIFLVKPLSVAAKSGTFADVTLLGKGYLRTTLDGTRLVKPTFALQVSANTSLTLLNLTLGAVQSSPASAGGVLVGAGASLSFQNGRIMNAGGGVLQGGCIHNSTVTSNVYLSNAALINCRAVNSGGAVMNVGTATIERTTIDGTNPTAPTLNCEHGGGITNQGDLFIRSSTLTRLKSLAAGSAIQSTAGRVFIEGSTIVENTVTGAGSGAIVAAGTFEMTASILMRNKNNNNPATVNCTASTALTSGGWNLFGTSSQDTCHPTSSAGHDRPGASNTLGSLVSAGGVGQVYLPSSSVPSAVSAIRQIPQNDQSAFCFDTDQRNIARARGLVNCDIGAVQSREVMFVVADPLNPTPGESKVLGRLVALGYVPLPLLSPTQATVGLDVGRLTVISDSVPTSLGARFLGSNSSVLLLNAAFLPIMKMTNSGDSGTQGTQSQLTLARVSPYSWLSTTGDLVSPLAVTGINRTFGWGRPVMTSQLADDNVATLFNDATRFAAFRYSSGNILAGDFDNPGPRGFFFAGAAANDLTAAGVRLLEETILATDTL